MYLFLSKWYIKHSCYSSDNIWDVLRFEGWNITFFRSHYNVDCLGKRKKLLRISSSSIGGLRNVGIYETKFLFRDQISNMDRLIHKNYSPLTYYDTVHTITPSVYTKHGHTQCRTWNIQLRTRNTEYVIHTRHIYIIVIILLLFILFITVIELLVWEKNIFHM